MLDCKHAGPSLLPPPSSQGRGLRPHNKLGAGVREKALGRGETRVPQVLGGERDPGVQCPAEHSRVGLVLASLALSI